MFTNIYFPFRSDDDISLMDSFPTPPNFDGVAPLNALALKESDVLFPVDEMTGLRENPLTKISDPRITPIERDRIMSTLQKVPTSARHRLSDDDLIKMLPSRYNQTNTDNEKYASYISGVVDGMNVDNVDSSTSDVDSSDTSDTSNT